VTEIPPESSGRVTIEYDKQDGTYSKVGGPPTRDLVIDSPPQLLSLDIYQDGALKTFNDAMSWADQVHNAVYGLGEAGEVANTIKKYFFHPWDKELFGNFRATREKVGKELGDLLYYVAVLSYLWEYTLGEVGKMNREKLIARHGKGNPNENKS
jgi:NTP pyrophosphatase (non-canonical NTP hydrolase)